MSSKTISHASIIPLIGGIVLGSEQAFGVKPQYMISYEPFKNNDQHIVDYYGDDVYYETLAIDNPGTINNYVDVVSTTCPCAGLSSLSTTASSDAAANDWMITSANYVLKNIRPKVFWGENAPRLASKLGEPVVAKLRKVAETYGYTFMIYKTKSILHGLSQIRDRTFYFFFEGDKIPVFNFIYRSHDKIDEVIRAAKADDDDPMNIVTTSSKPSENPYYRYILEKMHGGISHNEFMSKVLDEPRSINAMDYIENAGHNYLQVRDWFIEQNLDPKFAKRAQTMHDKLAAGKNIMRRVVQFPQVKIGAFVGHYPTHLAHPDEDRFLTIRECLAIMGFPSDFNLQGGLKNLNHVCQNVPVTTAKDMAVQIKAFLDGELITEKVPFAIIDNKTQQYHWYKAPRTLDEFL